MIFSQYYLQKPSPQSPGLHAPPMPYYLRCPVCKARDATLRLMPVQHICLYSKCYMDAPPPPWLVPRASDFLESGVHIYFDRWLIQTAWDAR